VQADDRRFGSRLRDYRRSAGLSQEELAARSGLSVRTIRNLESGHSQRPFQDTVRRLADALGFTGDIGDEFIAAAGRRFAADPIDVEPDSLAGAGAGYRHGLPLDTPAFTGRETELDAITGAAAAGAVAVQVITGMPGVGKTALAVRAAHLLASAFPDRQLFIDLHGHTPGRDPVSPADALAELLAAVGMDTRWLPKGLTARSALWRDLIADQQTLLVLDNAASADQVMPLLPGHGNCLVLVTSRRQLPELPVTAAPVMLSPLPAGPARMMFIRIARQAAGEDPELVDALTELAGQLPLAISVLARVRARHPAWTLAHLISETRSSPLTFTAENASVTAALTVSWRHLDAGPRRMLAMVGLHPGTSIDSLAAAALADEPAADAARQLDDLHRECLLIETGYRRYRVHDLIRSYAADQAASISSPDQNQAALKRLISYYATMAGRADAQVTDLGQAREEADGEPGAGIRALAWARAERANLLACLRYANAAGWRAEVVALTTAIAGLLDRDGPWPQAAALHATAAEAARHLDDRQALARCLINLARVRLLNGDYEAAASAAEDAVTSYRGLADRTGEAAALEQLAHTWLLVQDYPAGTEAVARALAIYRAAGDRHGQARALVLVASIWRHRDEYQAAGTAAAEAAAIGRSLDDRVVLSDALRQLGDVQRLTSDYDAALAYLQEALEVSRGLDDQLRIANSLTWLGQVRRLTGDYSGALADLEEAFELQRKLGGLLGQANALTLLGDARLAVGDHKAAVAELEHALRLYRDLGSAAGEASALGWLGSARLAAGDYPAAAHDLSAGLSISRQLGDLGAEATGLNLLARLRLAVADPAQARQLHQQALDIARQIDSRWDEGHALAGLGRCALAEGHAAEATRLLTQACQIFSETGDAEAAEIAAELESISSPRSGPQRARR
jgi:transcriptional regulator with XRE-family HTH domain/tetratricopeptide (TPR) repeat protein